MPPRGPLPLEGRVHSGPHSLPSSRTSVCSEERGVLTEPNSRRVRTRRGHLSGEVVTTDRGSIPPRSQRSKFKSKSGVCIGRGAPSPSDLGLPVHVHLDPVDPGSSPFHYTFGKTSSGKDPRDPNRRSERRTGTRELGPNVNLDKPTFLQDKYGGEERSGIATKGGGRTSV